MAINHIKEKEAGGVARGIINAVVDAVNSLVSTFTSVTNRLTLLENEHVDNTALATTVNGLVDFNKITLITVQDKSSVEIFHELSDYPDVKFIDSNGFQVTVSVQHLDGKRIIVSWNEAKSGKIIVKN